MKPSSRRQASGKPPHAMNIHGPEERQPSSRFRPLISSWMASCGQSPELVDMFFGGQLPELQFEQGGKKYWLLAGLPWRSRVRRLSARAEAIYLPATRGFCLGDAGRGVDAGETTWRRILDDSPRGPTYAQHAHGRGCLPTGIHLQVGLGHFHICRARVFTSARRERSPLRDTGFLFIRERRAHGAARIRIGRRSISVDCACRSPKERKVRASCPTWCSTGASCRPSTLARARSTWRRCSARAPLAVWTAAMRRARCSRSFASPPSSGAEKAFTASS